MPAFYYRLFGLTIQADFPIRELPAMTGVSDSPDVPDVTVTQGRVPATLDNACFEDDLKRVRGNEWLLDASEFAGVRVLIRNGREVTYQACGVVDRAWLEQLVSGHVMGALQYQRGRLPIHGNCLIYKGKTVLLCGHSGAGKSTASLALLRQGARLMADDLTALMVDGPGRSVAALPGMARLKLWQDSCRWLDLPAEGLVPVPGQPGKVYYRPPGCVEDGARTLDVVFCLVPDEHLRSPTVTALAGGEKLKWLQAHLYKGELAALQANWPTTFSKLAALAAACRIMLLRRPIGRFELPALLDCLETGCMTQ